MTDHHDVNIFATLAINDAVMKNQSLMNVRGVVLRNNASCLRHIGDRLHCLNDPLSDNSRVVLRVPTDVRADRLEIVCGAQ